jgi:hypothetical protein
VDNQPQVAGDHLVFRFRVAPLDPLGERDLLRGGEQRVPSNVVKEETHEVWAAARVIHDLVGVCRSDDFVSVPRA